jgi:hypothetical protein
MGWWKFIQASGRGFWAAPLRQKRRLLLAAALLPAVSVTLRVLGFRRCQAWMLRSAPAAHLGEGAEPRSGDWPQAAEIAWAVQKAARVTGSSCLPRSLVTWWLVRREGIGCELRIGVRKHGDRVQAHAWVEVEGRSVTAEESSFVPFEQDLMSREPSVVASPRA